ncbi:MAG: hypothetical protein GF311_08585 [Candidatus Lokiarchaeota archaeon]|nr:hypothetical protein [Candidatus Lokiarchaeota archaeon]
MIFQSPLEELLASPELMTIGITTIIFIIINLILGISMIYKGIISNYHIAIYISSIFFVGITLWGGVVVLFLAALIFNFELPLQIYFIIHMGFTLVLIFFWMVGITDLANIKGKKRKNFLIIFGIILATMQILYDIMIFVNPLALGTYESVIQIDYRGLTSLYQLMLLFFFTIPAGWIAYESYKAENPTIRLKARFLILYVLGITVGAILEIFLAGYLGSIIAKIIISPTMVAGYFGFMLPEKVEKFILNK